MSYARIAANMLLLLVLGVLFTPKTNLGASTRATGSSEQTQPTINLPEKDTAQIISDLYARGIIAGMVDSVPQAAQGLFEQVLELDPAHAPSLYEMVAYTFDSDPALATEYIKRAIAADSSYIDYHKELAKIYIIQNRYDSAKTVYEKIIKLEPGNPNNYHTLGTLYMYTNLPYSAISVLDSARTRFGNIPEMTMMQRDLLSSLRHYDKATELAQSLVDEYPYEARNYIALAELYGKQGDDSLATKAFNDALALDQNKAQVLLSMCDYYSQTKNTNGFLNTILEVVKTPELPLDRKVEIFNDHVRTREFYQNHYAQVNNIASTIAILYPNDFEAQDLYATHLVSSGQSEQALAVYKERLKTDPKNMDIYNYIIDIEAFMNRPDSIELYSKAALEVDPSDVNMYLRRSGVLQYLERFDEASQTLLKALKINDNDSIESNIYCTLGDIEQFQNNQKKSIAYYKKSLKYNSENILALNNYSYFLSTIDKDLEHALDMIEVVIASESNNPVYLDTQAWILYKLGEYEKAQQVMRTAISLDRGGNAELYLHYGDILYALGQNFMATTYWRKALESGCEASEIEKRINQTQDK